MAITLDALTASAVGTNQTTRSITHTCGAAAKILVVSILVKDATDIRPVTCTHNSVAVTQVAYSVNGGVQVWMGVLLNPSIGAQTTACSLSTTADRVIMVSRSYTEAIRYSGAVDAGGTSDTVSCTVVSQSGSLVVDACVQGWVDPTVGASQTDELSAFVDSTGYGFSREAGAASVTMSWTLGGSYEWATCAVSLDLPGGGLVLFSK